jgi:ADP-ribose pyrophosphatase
VPFARLSNIPAAVCIAVLDEEHGILVKQFRIAIGKYILEAPAGKIEKNEEPMERAKKELEEETGYRAGIFEYLGSAIFICGILFRTYPLLLCNTIGIYRNEF